MKFCRPALITPLFLVACATESEPQYDPLQDYEEVDTTTIMDAPDPLAGNFAPEHLFQVKHGEYLVELLGCGACHTNGALEGAAQMDMALAGSDIGIAFANPLGDEHPGIVFPPNLTSDEKTGLGLWSDEQIAVAIRAGIGRHLRRRVAVMPWEGYAKMSEKDVTAIVSYLRSIAPVAHKVPDEVKPGERSKHPFVYLGVYRSR
ncbi:MAG: c-type cytochrome [Gammaproteobacteria bacterium]|jgi:mono/diheme cytochrome c family protein|nr:c-type cytochrome [Gammaproteobacteria bacterium]MDH3749048.1 c-type cytochrome [Gammaproteobacteria bacterium]MDH3805721.1 c-type cytochrome [Gammaproteobacteria bacterium]